MSVYHPSFNFLNKNSYDDYNLVVAHFDGDSGESDTWLGMDPIYSDVADGTRRLDYGAKFNSVATPKITVIKSDGTDFTATEVRKFLRWTTGSRKNSYLELCEWNEDESKWDIKFRLFGRTTSAYQQKLDARTVGLIIEFTTVSPFAYSPVMNREYTINGTREIIIEHDTDDLDTPIYLNTTFKNLSGDSLTIYNKALEETTEVNNLAINEVVTLDANGFIKSDKTTRVFGTDFNYVFPRFGYDADILSVTGYGVITFEYVYFIKMGDCVIDVDMSGSGLVCGSSDSSGNENNNGGTIVVEKLSWENITDKPDLYTADEVDRLLLECNAKIMTLETTINNIEVSIDEDELNAMLAEVLV